MFFVTLLLQIMRRLGVLSLFAYTIDDGNFKPFPHTQDTMVELPLLWLFPKTNQIALFYKFLHGFKEIDDLGGNKIEAGPLGTFPAGSAQV